MFLRGDAGLLDEATTVDLFERQIALYRSRGWTKAPLSDRANIAVELVRVRIRPIQIRVEGFGDGAASFTWKLGAST